MQPIFLRLSNQVFVAEEKLKAKFLWLYIRYDNKGVKPKQYT